VLLVCRIFSPFPVRIEGCFLPNCTPTYFMSSFFTWLEGFALGIQLSVFRVFVVSPRAFPSSFSFPRPLLGHELCFFSGVYL